VRDVETHNSQLAGVLLKTYNLFTSTLLKELLKKVSQEGAELLNRILLSTGSYLRHTHASRARVERRGARRHRSYGGETTRGQRIQRWKYDRAPYFSARTSGYGASD